MALTGDTLVCVSNPETDRDLLKIVRDVADRHEMDVETLSVGADQSEADWDDAAVTVALGGDGTFLEAVRLASPSETPILAVNAGTLGFLARIHQDSLLPALMDTIAGDIEIIDREMLAVEGAVTGTGINDVMIESLPPEKPTDRKVTTIHAYIGGEYVGEYRGDGVAVSTPTGSTAVAYSAGGPVHYPNANSSLQLTPLLTHNSGVRPVIVDSSTTITIYPEDEVEVSIDGGRTHNIIGSREELTVTGKDRTAKIIRTSYDETFFDAMSGKLGWGLRGVDDPGPL